MNCLLALPHFQYQSGVRFHSSGYRNYIIPLGIGYISAALKRAGDLRLVTLNLNQLQGDWRPALEEMIERESIEVVLTGGLFLLFDSIREILRLAKRRDPAIITVVGGGLITGDPEAAMEALEDADYGIIGEGEITVAELTRALKNRSGGSVVPGLIYKNAAGGLVRTPARPEVKDLSLLPWCDYDGFGFDHYLRREPDSDLEPFTTWLGAKKALHMLTSRSCPNHCTFCLHPEGLTYRRRNLDDVFAELDALLAKYPVDTIYFVDELIGLRLNELEKFCARLKPYNLDWITSFRVNDVSPEKIRLLKESGCVSIFLGLESACDRILRSMKKGTTVQQIESALATCAAEKLMCQGTFIFGDPAETYESCLETLDWYLNHPQYLLNLGLMMFYPGTPIYWDAVASGRIGDRVQFLKAGCPAFNGSRMTDEEYQDIITNKIPEYKHQRYLKLPPAQEVSIEVRDESKISLSGSCCRCGRGFAYDRVLVLDYDSPIVCWGCGTLQSAPIKPAVEKVIRGNLRRLRQRYGQLAIWGINDFFRRTITPALAESILLFDPEFQGYWEGRPVESPDLLPKYGVACLIISPDAKTGISIVSAQAANRGLTAPQSLRAGLIEAYNLKDAVYLNELQNPDWGREAGGQ